VPWNHDILSAAESADGIVISNGPGDPADLGELVDKLTEVLRSYNKPVFALVTI